MAKEGSMTSSLIAYTPYPLALDKIIGLV